MCEDIHLPIHKEEKYGLSSSGGYMSMIMTLQHGRKYPTSNRITKSMVIMLPYVWEKSPYVFSV